MNDTAAKRPEPDTRSVAWALAPGTLLAGVAGGIAFPILPIVAERVGLPMVLIGVILAANRATRVIASPLVGMAADRFGGRQTLLVGLGMQLLVLLFYMLGITTGWVGTWFFLGRLLHGPASACVFIAAQSLALQAGGALHGGRAAGTVRASIVIGVPIGLAVGGLLSEAIGDAATFVVSAVAMLAALAVAFVRVPRASVTVGRSPSLSETLRAMRDRRLVAVGALNLVLNFAASGMILTTIALLVHERELSVLGRNEQGTAGLLMGLMFVTDAAATPLVGRLGDRFRAHAAVACGSMIALVIGLLAIGLADGVLGVGAGLLVVGVATAGLGPSLLVIIGSLVPSEQRGTGVGLLQLAGDVGGMVGPLVGTALLADDTASPYVGSAALVALFVPLAGWLVALERRRGGRVVGPPT
ncbi:MAG: MFS transporter [Sandaracinaceae bacterium]